ncbi:unnamed protein product, partial [marine sediment metagenome]
DINHVSIITLKRLDPNTGKPNYTVISYNDVQNDYDKIKLDDSKASHKPLLDELKKPRHKQNSGKVAGLVMKLAETKATPPNQRKSPFVRTQPTTRTSMAP